MDSKKPDGPQAGLRPWEQQALFLVPMQGPRVAQRDESKQTVEHETAS